MYAICVESSHERGMGHLFRGINLYHFLESKSERAMLFVNDNEPAVRLLQQQKIPYEAIDFDDTESDWESCLIRRYDVGVWINDKYQTDRRMYEHIKKNKTVLLTAIDEESDNSDLLDLHFVGMVFQKDFVPRGRRVFRGNDYIVLNPQISQYRHLRKDVKRIIVSMGGSDTYGVTVKVLRILQERKIPADIVIGPSFEHKSDLMKIMTEEYRVFQNVPSLIGMFRYYDLAVTGGGVTCFEAAASGLPCIIIASEVFEIDTAEYMERLGTAVFAGYHEQIDFSKFDLSALDIETMSRNGMQKITLHGAQNIYDRCQLELKDRKRQKENRKGRQKGMENKNIPINKGNYDMESKERLALFDQYRGEGWEKEYRAYRDAWEKNAKEQITGEYPLLVDLETSTVCNLHCPMCYTVSKAFKDRIQPTLMKTELFYKIIDEIAGKVPAIRMSLRGEPTLHPDFLEMVKYARKKGIPEISFLTNGSHMTPDYFEQILLAGVDWITVSIDGTDEMYESIRKPLKFSETLEKIKAMKAIKDKYQVHRPVIKIQSIWPAISENAEEFYHIFEPYVDVIAFNPMSDDQQNDTEIEYVEDFSCPQLYQRIIVTADGSVLPCANDEESDLIIGNAYEQTIYELWHGDEMQRLRNLHKEKDGYMQEHICRKCYLPRKMEVDQIIEIDGREIIVEAYTKRSQVIGQ